MKNIFKFFSNIQGQVMQADNVVYKELHLERNITPVFTVEQIHKDFDTATDEINDYDETLAALFDVGFSQSPDVAANAEKRDIIARKKIAQERFPNYKYIPESVVHHLCEKYSLIIGSTQRYIKDIPKKNAVEIANFHRDVYTKLEKEHNERIAKEFSGMSDMQRRFELQLHNWTSYSICAPKSHFRLKGGDRIVNNRVVVEDPIVLFPYLDGYLIVSKWGDEANDIELSNEKHN